MQLLYSSPDLTKYRNTLDPEMIVGFVPTMGALHEGHLSLVREAKKQSDIVIVSIFVNPTQFNNPDDLKNYPRTLEEDIAMLRSEQTDAIFIPGTKDIYPQKDTRIFDFGILQNTMEGLHRPGHFNGVAQVVTRLFDLVSPHKAFFGQKDFQQLAIIKKLVELFHYNIKIVACPIKREKDGLAMSSRNRLLTKEQRAHAPLVAETLFSAVKMKNKLSPADIKTWVLNTLNNDPMIKVEYFEIVNSLTLTPVNSWSDPVPKTGCLAVKIGNIRLIDNVFFD